MRIRWRVHLLALLTYTLWALVLTWPLLTHLTTHVPGNGADDPPLTWNLWWVRFSLLELQANPYQCSHLFYPVGINLAFYTLTLLNGLLSIPMQASLGLITASNVLLLSSFVLSGYGTFLLVTYLLRSNGTRSTPGAEPSHSGIFLAAALSAGLVYAFASSKLFYAALGQWNITSSQWIPFFLLYLFKTGESPHRLRYALLAAAFLLLQAYAELTYASFLVLFTVLWAAWQAWALRSPARHGQRARIAGSILLIALLTAIGLIPTLANMASDILTEGDVFAEGGGFADVFSADLAGFFVPTSLHPVFGGVVDHFAFPHDVGQHLYLGYSVILLCLAGVVYWHLRGQRLSEPDHRVVGSPFRHTSGKGSPEPGPKTTLGGTAHFWSLSALVWWLFTLGPTLRVNDHVIGIPLPFRLVEQLPFFKGNRYPSRYSVLLTVSLAVLVGLGVAAFLDWSRRETSRRRARMLHLAAPLLVLLVLFEHLAVPLPLSDMRVPAVYEEIAAMPGDWTLLDMPVAWRNGARVTGTLDTIVMFEQYYQAVHQKQVLAGNTSRNPPLKFQYFSQAPVISTLIALETGHEVAPEVVARDQALAPDVLRFFDIRAIVVHPVQAGDGVIPYLESTMPVTRFYEDAETMGYRVELPNLPRAWVIAPGEELSPLSYAEGWGAPANGWIWVQRKRARLLVPMNGQPQTMEFQAYAPSNGQVLSIEVNGYTAGTLDLEAGSHYYSVNLPLLVVHAGLNEVVLRSEQLSSAGEVPIDSRPIGQTGHDSPVSIVVKSAGNEVGDLALIYLDGRQVSPNQRGYNLVVLDAQTGVVVDTVAFDTHMDETASQSMADYLEEIPLGRLVVVAAADEASRLLGIEVSQALRGIGAEGDMRGKFRWGHAIIGVRGAPPGTAMEAMDWMRPVTLAVGTGAIEPRLAVAFGTITFSATSP